MPEKFRIYRYLVSGTSGAEMVEDGYPHRFRKENNEKQENTGPLKNVHMHISAYKDMKKTRRMRKRTGEIS
jgi:hypothetical protein